MSNRNEFTPEQHAKRETFRKRLEPIAGKAIESGIAPIDVAGAFIGIGLTTLVQALGQQKASEYLYELAAEIVPDTDDAPSVN